MPVLYFNIILSTIGIIAIGLPKLKTFNQYIIYAIYVYILFLALMQTNSIDSGDI